MNFPQSTINNCLYFRRRDQLCTPAFLGFPGVSTGKESTRNMGNLGSILGWEDPLEKGKSTHSSILA